MATYVLGTGVSHDGSSCLIRDGVIVAAVEKERLTRKKHDGFNDRLTLEACLDIAGVGWREIDLLVENNTTRPASQNARHRARRGIHPNVPIVSISHHLAHAYSAIGTSPYDKMAIAVIDGRGSSMDSCLDVRDDVLPSEFRALAQPDRKELYEKESLYIYHGGTLEPVLKDFSRIHKVPSSLDQLIVPGAVKDGIGAVYGSVARYIFGGNFSDGKLMGLAPYGTTGRFSFPTFDLRDGRVFCNPDWVKNFPRELSNKATTLKKHFQMYADLALHIQQETERAILYLFKTYYDLSGMKSVGYAGGVALNAVCNGKILSSTPFDNLYIQPAAGDAGVALGSAFYGWLKVLRKARVPHDGSSSFGPTYSDSDIRMALEEYTDRVKWSGPHSPEELIGRTARSIADGRVIGWFQGRSEFGPRALGNRSILADPRREGVRDFINEHVKQREDFRPLAPAILESEVDKYFVGVSTSPYMLLVAQGSEELRRAAPEIVHCDGSARVQTVNRTQNPLFWNLIRQFKYLTGIPVLLNTSLNRRAMPIVEKPAEALSVLMQSKLDNLVLGSFIVERGDH